MLDIFVNIIIFKQAMYLVAFQTMVMTNYFGILNLDKHLNIPINYLIRNN
jgi:hypothetical protein